MHNNETLPANTQNQLALAMKDAPMLRVVHYELKVVTCFLSQRALLVATLSVLQIKLSIQRLIHKSSSR